MSYSYEKQIERLLKFVKKIADNGCQMLYREPCLPCEAKALLNDEPVNATTLRWLGLEDSEGENPPMGGMKL